MNGFGKLIANDGVTGTRFVRRMYLMRILGTFLCFLPILSVLIERQQPLILQLLLGIQRLYLANGRFSARASCAYSQGCGTTKSVGGCSGGRILDSDDGL
ncbi:Uncharacterised protein [Kluyvera cryocrescens]|uniref:Uncharacterized protein n=1 Tax=Kluyvera cryocrescens TaxID=580 RepID=A0A485CS23_KLUCR|nr:Uncharacterised protein [Kluyvera cryocrescens]